MKKFGICNSHRVLIPLPFFKSNFRFPTKVTKTFPDFPGFPVINYDNILTLDLFSPEKLNKNIHSLHQSHIHKSYVNITK